jgi:hypothetical protein
LSGQSASLLRRTRTRYFTLTVTAVLTVLATLTTGMRSSPAEAAANCTHSHGWSFWQDTSLPRYQSYVYIKHSSTACPTTSSYDYKASNVNTGMYHVTVWDNKCDNLGMTLYTHKAGGGYNSEPTGGCGYGLSTNWPISSVAYPWVWWVNVGGVNSPNYALPDAPP